ncbi:hypothetical protein [Vibrio phage CAU_VPP01]|nr:hypothetical protein [Vibrio phage CAU_VPP01]
MKSIETVLESFNYDDLIAKVMVAVKEDAESIGYDVECVAMVAYSNTYEAKESDNSLNVDALTFDCFLSSMIESANLIITHRLFD